jgi:ribose transport system permease protein
MTQLKATPRENSLKLLKLVKDYIILIAIICLVIIFSVTSEHFFSIPNFLDIIRNMAVLGIASAGILFVIISGGIDISIGSILGLGGIAFFAFYNLGLPLFICIIVGIIVGAILGLVNGVLINKARITPLVATLITMNIARGTIYTYARQGLVPELKGNREVFNYIALGKIGFMPVAIIILIIVYIILWYVLEKSTYGMQLKSVGYNEECAKLSGINVNKVRYIAYIISGVCAAVAGIIFFSKTASGQHQAGIGLEFLAITAVVLGGASLSGGKGNIWLTLLGVGVLAVLGNGMNMLNINYYFQLILQAVIIIAASTLDQYRK